VRFTVPRLLIAVLIAAITLVVEMAVFDAGWRGQSSIYYIDRPPLPLMIVAAAVPGLLAILCPSPRNRPASK
jgi:hypothetical protein